MKIQALALLALFTVSAHASLTAPLDVTLSGVKQISGSVRVAIYDSAESFQKTPHRTLVVPVDSATIKFSVDDLAVGQFAIMLYQDVDDDGKMKTNLVGMPSEPWGSSLQGKAVFGPPNWKNVVFDHADAGTSLNIELR